MNVVLPSLASERKDETDGSVKVMPDLTPKTIS